MIVFLHLLLAALATLTFNTTTGAVTGGTPGKWLVHFSYDGLGRLVRKQAPYNQAATQLRAIYYYYDGVRRVQEVFTDPVTKSHPLWLDKENPPDENTLPPVMAYVDRDYVWAPPPSGYVDECLAQVELDGQIAHVVQDATYDVVALVDGGKPAGTPGYPNGAAAKVLMQYTYDAYGQPITAEDLTSSPPGRTPGGGLSSSAAGNATGSSASGGGDIYSHAANRLGHKGLFFDRLDARPDQDPSVGDGAFDLLPRARGLYHVRNRTLDPVQGRWIQADPNGMGLPLAGWSDLPPKS